MKRRVVAVCLMLSSMTGACAPHSNQEALREQTAAPTSTKNFAHDAHTSTPLPISPESADAAEPAAATGRDGTAFVAWVEHLDKMQADVMLMRIDRAGQPSGVPVRVNPRAGEATAWRGDAPTVDVAPDGTLYVGWTARVEGKRHANDLYLSVSRDEGRTFEPPVKINDDRQPADRGMHSLAVSPTDNRIHVAWLDERNVAPPPPSGATQGHEESNREVFTAFSTDGGRTFSPNKIIAREACPCCKTTLVAGMDGRVYASWRQVLPGEYRHIAVASSGDGGQTFTAPVIVSDDRWMLAGCPVSGAAMAVGDDGALRVLWYSEGAAGERGLYWSESRDGGQTFAPRRLFARGMTRGTPTLLRTPAGGSRLTAVWEGNDGTTLHPSTGQIAEDGNVTSVSPITSDGELPAATPKGNGFLIAYITKASDRRRIYLAHR